MKKLSARTTVRSLLLCLAALAFFALGRVEARADVVTSGFFFIGIDPSAVGGYAGTFVFQGTGLSVTGATGRFAGYNSTFDGSVRAGATIPLGDAFGPPESTRVHFPLTVGGVTYDVGGPAPFPSVFLRFNAPSITLPSDLGSSFTVTAPFSLSGSIVGNPNAPTPLQAMLTGEGTAYVTFVAAGLTSSGQVFYRPQSLEYRFGEVAPGVTLQTIPEPATLLLLGTGLAGVAAGVRRRRSRA